MPKSNLFKKMIGLIVIMLVPIVSLYFYSNKTNVDVLEKELNRSNTNQLLFFQNQVNANIDLLSLWPNLLILDPDIKSFRDIFRYSEYLDLDSIMLIKRIQKKLNIQESSLSWKTALLIYSPTLKRVVSANDARVFDEADLKQRMQPGWQVSKSGSAEQQNYTFSFMTTYPYSTFRHPENANLVIEVQFDSGNIADMLDKFKSDGRRDPFFYKKDTGIIFNRTADRELAKQLIELLERHPWKDVENRTVDLGGESYYVNIVHSRTTGWYLIDYMPLSDIVAPIRESNRIFYMAVGGLMLMSCMTAYLLYAQVQVPLRQIVTGFQKLKNGDYSVRMNVKRNNEFGFVFSRFNSMVVQIQDLFERVYKEKIHVREARLKQLQSQINPHFLYNCFSFIASMAKLKNTGAVVAMAENLSRYYRYTTRQERDMAPLSDEFDFIASYLEIQKMRMKRLHVDLRLPDRMRKIEVPPLVLQPLVENAVLHGIEPHAKSGRIRIIGEWNENGPSLTVEDDGCGMSDQELSLLTKRLREPMEEEKGCGLWNVYQRMLLRFGPDAEVRFAASELGGLKVTLAWPVMSTDSKTDMREIS